MNTKINRPGIIQSGSILKPTSWRGIKPGDEMWFFVSHGAEGTTYGGIEWFLANNEKLLRVGWGDKPEENCQSVFGWPFPQTKAEFELPDNQEKLKDLLWTTQVLLSAVTCLTTELDQNPPALGPGCTIKYRRIAVLRFGENPHTQPQ